MILLVCLKATDSILTIAACLSHKSPFVAPFNKRNEADKRKKSFAICFSDHLTVLKGEAIFLILRNIDFQNADSVNNN